MIKDKKKDGECEEWVKAISVIALFVMVMLFFFHEKLQEKNQCEEKATIESRVIKKISVTKTNQ